MPVWLAVTVVVVAIGALAAGARAAFVVVTVVGVSMLPTLRDGDRVLVARRWLRPVRRGAIVAARWQSVPVPDEERTDDGPQGPFTRRPPAWVIKRAAALGGDPVSGWEGGDGTVPPGAVFLLGDNATASDDSRAFGPLPMRDVVGVVVRRLSGGNQPVQ
jgi:signal peptidase I